MSINLLSKSMLTQSYRDSLSSRVLPFCNTDIPHDTLTVPACIDKCASLGYTSAGVEYGQECYCGNVNYPIGQSLPMSNCDMACLGDATQICGGHLTLLAYTKPTHVTYKGILQVLSGTTPLGYVAIDPNYWTPLLTPDMSAAVALSFQGASGATSFTHVGLSISDTFPFFGLVVGRDSTSSDIAPGSFNYLYLDQMDATAPGSTPQSGPSFFATSTGLDKQGESNDWNINLSSGAVTAQWINTDGSKSYLVSPRESSSLTHQIQVCRPRYFFSKATTSTRVEMPMHSTADSLLPSSPLLSNGSHSSTFGSLHPTLLALPGGHLNYNWTQVVALARVYSE